MTIVPEGMPLVKDLEKKKKKRNEKSVYISDQCQKIRNNNITDKWQEEIFGTQGKNVIFYKPLQLTDQICEPSFISISTIEKEFWRIILICISTYHKQL